MSDEELIQLAKEKIKKATDKGDNGCAIVVVNEKSPVERGPCHGFIRNHDMATEAKAIVSRIKRHGSQYGPRQDGLGEAAVRYYDWLFNRSPWAFCYVSKDAQLAMEEECSVLRVDVPANILQGALISSRNTWEFPGNIALWDELVHKHGVDEHIAFLSCYFVSTSDNQVTPSPIHRDHTAVSTRNIDKEGVKAFLSNTPLFNQALYNRGGDYQGVLDAWQGKGSPIFERFREEFDKFGEEGKSAIENPFAKAKPRHNQGKSMNITKYAAFVKEFFGQPEQGCLELSEGNSTEFRDAKVA